MIKITDLSKKYGRKTILENVSCLLEDYRIYALVGVNGIGKSTLLNAVTQPAKMDSGKVEIDGIDNRKCSGQQRDVFEFNWKRILEVYRTTISHKRGKSGRESQKVVIGFQVGTVTGRIYCELFAGDEAKSIFNSGISLRCRELNFRRTI